MNNNYNIKTSTFVIPITLKMIAIENNNRLFNGLGIKPFTVNFNCKRNSFQLNINEFFVDREILTIHEGLHHGESVVNISSKKPSKKFKKVLDRFENIFGVSLYTLAIQP